MHFKSLASLLAILLCLVFNVPAQAQTNFPEKPVKLIVPFPPGQATDMIARMVAEKLTIAWGHQVIVENKTGVPGMVAGSTAAPDGYTMTMGTSGVLAVNPAVFTKLPYDVAKDFIYVGGLAITPMIIVVSAGLPYNTIQELIAAAKKEPGKLTCGSSGTGGLIHLTCEMFKVAAGIDVLHIPYKGTSLLMPDLISGRVTMALDTLPPYLPMLKDGKVRALAITTAKRSALRPDLPTVAESGYPGFESIASYGFFAPTGTSPAIIERLNRDINAVLIDPELKAKLVQQAIELEGSTPQALAAFVDGEIAKWATVIKVSNIQRE